MHVDMLVYIHSYIYSYIHGYVCVYGSVHVCVGGGCLQVNTCRCLCVCVCVHVFLYLGEHNCRDVWSFYGGVLLKINFMLFIKY